MTNVNDNLKAVTLLVAPHSYTPLLHSSLPNFVMHPAGQTNTASPFFPKFSTHCQCVMQLLVLPITLLHTFVTHLCYMPLVHVFVTRLCYTMSCLSCTFVTCACYVSLFNIISRCFNMPYVTNCYICYTLIGKHICYTVVAQLFYTQLLQLKI